MRARYAGPQRTPKHEVRRTTPRFLVIWQVGSLLPLPALGSDVQGLPHPLLSGPPVGLGPGCGQREATSMCRPSQRAVLAWPLPPSPPPPHPVSRSCLFSPSSLPQASVTVFLFLFFFNERRKKIKRNHNSQPFSGTTPSLSLFHKQAPGMSHPYLPVTPAPTATSFCPILLPVPPSTLTTVTQE